MSLQKVFMNGFAVAVLAIFVSGCGMFDSTSSENEEMFRIKKDKAALGVGDNKGENGGKGDGAGSAEISTVGNANDPNKVGEWGSGTQSSAYDDFGTVIPGVKLPTVYFSFDRSMISSAEAPKLDEIAKYLMSNAGTGVVIEGNCDEKGSDEYNRALGERRALAAKEYLLNKGVQENRIRTISFGEERPAADNTSEAGRAKNRRDDFVAVKLRN